MVTNTVGGGIDQTAIIGHAPEMRDWKPWDPAYSPIIDPTARIEAYVTVDAGSEAPTRIGARTWLLKNGTHIGHDAVIGEDCEICCGAKIGGFVVIGDRVKVGLGAIVLPNVVIGADARIGAGAVVTRDVPAGETWVGSPARRLVKGERRPWGVPGRVPVLAPVPPDPPLAAIAHHETSGVRWLPWREGRAARLALKRALREAP